MSISWLVLISYLLNVEMFTDVVAVLQLKCRINTFIFFAVTMGINREIMAQNSSSGYLCPLLRMDRRVSCSLLNL